ncbi:MAG: transketolase [Armatimonadetes bacterium]|jgi:transketolase|nr:transketolase [Armatimonadota bacterium]
MAVAIAPAPAGVSLEALAEKARLLRKRIITMTTQAGSGHPSSSLSTVEVLTALYFGGVLRYDPRNPRWPERDRFILSKGHAAPALYAALAEAGFFPVALLRSLRKAGSPLEGHPNMRVLPGVEASTGSLGQGLSIGVGHALAARLDNRLYRVYVLTGDGENDEGQIWEAAMAAAKYHLDQLTCIIDHNGFQQTGPVPEVMPLVPLADKWRAFGWHARDIDGHDLGQVLDALHAAARVHGQPTAIIAHTRKGRGVSFVENDYTYHGKALTPEEADRALEELGWK